MNNKYDEVTIFIIGDKHFTVKGDVEPIDSPDFDFIEEVTEVAESTVIYCYTVIPKIKP